MHRRDFLWAAGGATSLLAGCGLGPRLEPALDLDVPVRAGPVVVGDVLYFTTDPGRDDAAGVGDPGLATSGLPNTATGRQPTAPGDLVAVELDTGRVTRPVRDAVRARHAPAVAGGEAAFCGRACRLFALDSGLVWERSLPDVLGGRATGRPPVVREGHVAFGLETGAFAALDRATGEVLWTTRPGGGAPVGWAAGSDRTVVTTAGGTTVVLDPADGRVVAERRFEEALAPAVVDGDVFLAGWQTRAVTDDLRTRWSYVLADVVRTPVRAGGRLYLAGHDENRHAGDLAALSVATGELLWTTDFRGGAVGPPVVGGDGAVTVGTLVAGTLVRVSPTGEVVRRVGVEGRLAGPLRGYRSRVLALTEGGVVYVAE